MQLIKNYLYNSFYQILIILIPFITVPYITRVLGQDGYGISAYTNSVIQYFIMFGSIGISLYGSRGIAFVREDKEKRSKVFWNLVILRIITLMISLLLFFIFIIYSKKYVICYLCQSLFLFSAMIDITWYFIGIEDFKKTVIRSTLIRLSSLALIFIFVKTSADLWKYILINSGTTLLGQLFLWSYMKEEVNKIVLSFKIMKENLLSSIKLFIPEFAVQIHGVLNKTLLGIFASMAVVGNFEAGDRMITIAMTLATSLGTVMLPRIANSFSKQNHEEIKTYMETSFMVISAIAIPLCFGLIAIADNFSLLFFGEKFVLASYFIKALAFKIILVAWSTIVGYQYLLATNQVRGYTVSVFIGAIVSIVINIMVTPINAKMGVCSAVLISELVVVIYQFYYVRKQLSLLPLFFTEIWKYFLASFGMLFVTTWFQKQVPSNFISIAEAIAIGGLFYVLCLLMVRSKVFLLVFSLVKNKN